MIHPSPIPVWRTQGRRHGVAAAGLFAAAIGVALAVFPLSPAIARTNASIVIAHPSGAVLHESNADASIYPASLTKMMTLYLAFRSIERGKLSLRQRLPVSGHAQAQPPSKLGLKPGQTIGVEQAIVALATKSANDVAVVLAEAMGGSESAFAAEMTRTARSLGMSRTTFVNASGLPDDRQVTTARDLARLSQALVRHWPQYYHYFKRSRFHYGSRTYRSHNRLMERYDGMDGIKTGYIRASGFNLAASAVRNGQRLITVVIGGRTARERDDRVAALMDEAFAKIASDKPLLVAAPALPPAMPESRRLGARVPLPVVATGLAPADPAPGGPEAFVAPVPGERDAVLTRVAATRGVADLLPVEAGDAEMAGEEDEPATPALQLAAVPVPKPAVAPRAAAAPAVRAAVAKPEARRQPWAVQVGAFHSKADSQRALTQASRVLSSGFRGLSKALEPVATRKGTVYRARLYGLASERLADSACSMVRKAGQRCLTVAPN